MWEWALLTEEDNGKHQKHKRHVLQRKSREVTWGSFFCAFFSLSFQDQIRTAFPSVMKCSDNTQKLTPKKANQSTINTCCYWEWHGWCSVLKSLTKKKLWTNRKRITATYLFCVIELWLDWAWLRLHLSHVTAYRAHLPGYVSMTNRAFVLCLPARSLLQTTTS